ncbi:MAG: flippase-like domain-containing protein [Chloracidobacterium sp.]|nr:flippase-like domain-containing protein [Chloracidobacterium sp.]MDW8217729.1 lysylphosphatidylglycerol synthase transmembrane domain-containing protein [Acidobacteriota bacterium]
MTTTRRRSLRPWWTAAKWLALLVLLALAAHAGHLRAVIAALGRADRSWIAAAFGLGAVMLVLRTAKWRWLLVRVHPQTSWLTAARSLLGGMALGLVTPGRVGEVGRAAFLPPGVRLTAAGLFIIDRAADLAALGAAACLGTLGVAPTTWRWPLALAGVGCVGMVFVLPVVLSAVLAARRLPGRLREKLCPAATALAQLRRRDIAANIAAGLALTALDIVSLYALARAFEPVRFAVVAFAFPWIVLTNLVPVTPAGVGVREGAAAGILQAYGVALPTAVNAALLLFAINTLAPALVGLVWIGKRSSAA